MKAFKKQAFVIIGALLSLTLLSCGGGGGGGVPGGGNSSATVITGHVADGFVAGATVTAHQVNANGTQGAQIGTPVLTDQSGNYTLNLGTYSGPVLLTSTGGTYIDTVTGTTIDLTNSSLILSTIVPNASGNVTAEINPLTTMAANVALTLVGQGTPVATAADAANTSIQNYFGLTSSILNTALVNLTTTGCMTGHTQPSADVSAILAGISQLAFNNGVSSLDLVIALVQDVTSDGKFDGLASGATIPVPLTSGTGTLPLSTIEGTALTGLANAITAFMTSTSNVCGASVDPGVISALSNALPGQWAQTVTVGSNQSVFSSVTVTSDGSVYAAGSIYGTGGYTFSTGVTATGTYSGGNILLVKYNSSGAAQWAQTVTAGSNQSSFSSVSVASDGSVYAAGSIDGTGTYNFGNGVTATGTYSGGNIVLVKYNSSGAAQWARTVTTGSNQSSFTSVSVASDGSVYAAGFIDGTVAFNFGNSVTAAGTVNGGNPILVKYNSSGVAQWAQTVTAGSGGSYFYGVSVASDGLSVYAAGSIDGTGTYTFGNSITATGTSTGGNVVLVKYNNLGVAQWARTATGGNGDSFFTSVSVAPDGSVYAAGYIVGTGTYTFGTGVTATGTSTGGINTVLAKYNSSGAAQWAQTVTAGSDFSIFFGVSVASDGTVYAAGYISGTGAYNFGNSVTVAGTYSGENIVLVIYDSSGVARSAQTVTAGSNASFFTSVAAASDGSVYAAGAIDGTGTFNFGAGLTAAGTNSGGNIVLVKYKGIGSITLSW